MKNPIDSVCFLENSFTKEQNPNKQISPCFIQMFSRNESSKDLESKDFKMESLTVHLGMDSSIRYRFSVFTDKLISKNTARKTCTDIDSFKESRTANHQRMDKTNEM